MHWKAYGQTDKKYISYLFDETGTYVGYIQKTSSGIDGYAGRPGKYIGTYASVKDAKQAVETESKLQ